MSQGGASWEPITATGTEPANVDGQAIAITVFSAVKWWGRPWLALVFFAAQHLSGLVKEETLEKLSFIHFARWSLVREIAYNGAPQPRERLHYPHLFFESNFNGGWQEYIDAFSRILTKGMWVFWGSSYGFPQPLPTGPFKAYIKENELQASHFYSAYPPATATMVTAGLGLSSKFTAFLEQTARMTAAEFEQAWHRFLSENQDKL